MRAVVEVKTGDLSQVKDAPEYRPTLEEWKDPMAYVEKIRQEAENFGIAKIIPPAGWAPPYALKDDFKFPTYAHNNEKQQHRTRTSPDRLVLFRFLISSLSLSCVVLCTSPLVFPFLLRLSSVVCSTFTV